jgi:hypothetical protein
MVSKQVANTDDGNNPLPDAARMIAECQDEQKRWRCMHELRKLQARLNYPTL